MNLSFILLSLSAAFYAVSFAAQAASFFGSGGNENAASFAKPAFTLLRIGFLLGTFYFAAEAVEHGFFLPVVNLPQAMAFFSWSLGFVYLVLLSRIQAESFGLILSPVLLVLVLASCFFSAKSGDLFPPQPVLLNPYFTIHIVSAFFAYASFTISFAAGILYLIQHRELKSRHAGTFYHKLPSLEELEKLICRPLLWGAPLLLAAAGIGFVWSKSAFGEYWIFDPKTIATVATAFLYLVILYLRSISVMRGRQVALMSLVAFAFVLFSFVGTRFIQGSHNYFQ